MVLSSHVSVHLFSALYSLCAHHPQRIELLLQRGDHLSFKKMETHDLNLVYHLSYPQNHRLSVTKCGESVSVLLNVLKISQEGILKTEVWTTSSKGKELSLSADLFINTALRKTTDNCNGANSPSSIAITPSGLSGTAQDISSMKEN